MADRTCFLCGGRVSDKSIAPSKSVLNSPAKARNWCEENGLATADRELFAVLTLDARHHVISSTVVSVGTVSSSLVHPREVFKQAIADHASGLVAIHNHPSGDADPSPDDCEITRRMQLCGEIVGILLIDHVIVSGHRYYSFRESGFIDPALARRSMDRLSIELGCPVAGAMPRKRRERKEAASA